jgi:hypothetical protein
MKSPHQTIPPVAAAAPLVAASFSLRERVRTSVLGKPGQTGSGVLSGARRLKPAATRGAVAREEFDPPVAAPVPLVAASFSLRERVRMSVLGKNGQTCADVLSGARRLKPAATGGAVAREESVPQVAAPVPLVAASFSLRERARTRATEKNAQTCADILSRSRRLKPAATGEMITCRGFSRRSGGIRPVILHP